MPKKRSVVPFYGKDAQHHEGVARIHARNGNGKAASIEADKARECVVKRRNKAGQ